MAKTISTTLGEVFVVEMDPIEKDGGYRWNLKWVPAGLQFLEQQVMEQEDGKLKQRFLFLSAAQYSEDTVTIVFVLQSDNDLNDIKSKKEIKVDWNANLQFVSYNPNNAGAYVSNVVEKYGFPCMARDDQPFLKHRNMVGNGNDYCGTDIQKYGFPCIAQSAQPYGLIYGGNMAGNGNDYYGTSIQKYGYPCFTPPVMPYGPLPMVAYGYPCMAQTAMPYGMVSDNTAMIYNFPMDAGLKYGYACTAQASMPYGYGLPNYDGK